MDGKQCAGSVLGLANQIKRVFDTTTGRCGTQVRILNFVLVSYPDREIYQKDIEEELNIRSASVSALLKKMEAQDFIRREKVSCDDRLKKILSITNCGNEGAGGAACCPAGKATYGRRWERRNGGVLQCTGENAGKYGIDGKGRPLWV